MIMYQALDVSRSDSAQLVVGASKTNFVISRPSFSISDRGSLNSMVKVTAASVTVTNAITVKLQTVTDTAGTWVDSKTVSISGNGDFYISLQAARGADQTYLPLLPLGRIVVTTGVGDAATFSAIMFVQGV